VRRGKEGKKNIQVKIHNGSLGQYSPKEKTMAKDGGGSKQGERPLFFSSVIRQAQKRRNGGHNGTRENR